MAESAGLGRQLLIKIGDGADPETFAAACGFKDRSFKINNNIVDTTAPDCTNPTGKVGFSGAYGIQTLTVSGSGKATTSAQFKALKTACLNQTKPNLQIIVPGDGTYEGAALIGDWEDTGGTENELEFSCEITLSGTITYTAEGA